jgi:hypothetical protein
MPALPAVPVPPYNVPTLAKGKAAATAALMLAWFTPLRAAPGPVPCAKAAWHIGASATEASNTTTLFIGATIIHKNWADFMLFASQEISPVLHITSPK